MGRRARLLLYPVFAFLLLAPPVCFYEGSLWKDGAFTLRNWADCWPSAAQWRALGNSLRLGLCATLLCLAFGLPAAAALSRLGRRWRHLLSALCLIPLMIPPYLTASAWVAAAGKTSRFDQSMFGFGGCLWVFSLSFWPVVALLGCACLRLLDRRLVDAGRLSAGGGAVFRRITLPLVWPDLAAAAGVVFVLVLADSGVGDLLLFKVYSNEVLQSFRWGADMPAAAVVSLPLMLCVALAVAFIGLYPARRSRLLVGGSAESLVEPAPRREDAGRRAAGLAWLLLLLALSVAFPVAMFASASASWEAYREALGMSRGLLGSSFLAAALGASATLLLCLPLAVLTSTGSRAERACAHLLSLSTFALPATVVGVGLIALFNRPGLPGRVYHSVAILAVAYVVRFSFIAWAGVSAVWAGVAPSLFEAARLSGASPWRACRRVFLPLAAGSLWALFLVLFILCFGELGLGVLLTPAGSRTFPVTLFGLLHFGYEKLVMAMCLMFFVSIAVPAAAAMALWRKYGDSRLI